MTSLTLRRLLALLLALAMLSVCRAAAPARKRSGKDAELEASIRKLEKEIEKVRGLKFLKPVVAHVISRPKEGREGIQGYYDLKKKALFLFDDIKGSYQKGVLIHEMVHALQDQHFGLDKLHDPSISADAELARAALIEGDATLTMIEVLGKEQPYAAKMLSVPLEKSRHLQNAFLYAQGARFVQALKKRGGWSAVDIRYRFPPQSTATILHPDERIRPLNLGPGKPVGELGLIRLLLGQPVTAPESVKAAAGWRGDRTIVEGNSRAWLVGFASAEQAGRFHRALADLRAAEYPKHKVAVNEPGTRIFESDRGAKRGILLRSSRVLELVAPDDRAYQALLDRVDGPPKMHIHSAKEKRQLTFGELIDRLMEADLVCVGETHDSELDHQVQGMIIKALYARDERLGVGMEMFQRPYQKTLDRYVAGAINEETLLEDSDYRKRWGFDWGLYQGIVQFCRRNGVPLAGLNVADELRQKVSRQGYEKLSAEDKKQLGKIDFQVKEHRAYWFDKLGKMHGHGEMPEDSKERFYQVMTLWDEYMAASAARFQKERKVRRMVILAGSGHIERGFGIPDRVKKRTGGKVLTVRIVLGDDPGKVKDDPAADFVVLVQ
jgi:uncharacterized iron-regulated protein